jgi:Gpi18-like mannosyltransferase
VWYEAQILAFLFSVSAIAALRRDKCTLACLCYALSVGCRPFSVVLGPVLLMMYIQDAREDGKSFRQGAQRLLPGLFVGLCIAACYAAYNYIRFGDIFEFGHNHLPEFTRAEHGQLSLEYVGKNWKTLFFGPPFSVNEGNITINQFGFSMFLSCPILICNVVWAVQDVIRRRFTPIKAVILLMAAANVFLLLMHRTLGGHQFGARYALELVPLCLCYLLLSPDRRSLTRWECALMAFGLLFNFVGGCLIHI